VKVIVKEIISKQWCDVKNISIDQNIDISNFISQI
jgi:hypothetical protein